MSILPTPDFIAQLQALAHDGTLDKILGRDGRTPERRGPLQNLNGDPAALGRPTFVWSAKPTDDMEPWKTYPFPRLAWSPTGTEVTTHDQQEFDRLIAQGYSAVSPTQRAETPEERLQREYDALPPEDQRWLQEQMDLQRKQKLLELAGSVSSASFNLTTKRGPGRPKKVVNE